jgi:hypothetical protein
VVPLRFRANGVVLAGLTRAFIDVSVARSSDRESALKRVRRREARGTDTTGVARGASARKLVCGNSGVQGRIGAGRPVLTRAARALVDVHIAVAIDRD